MALDLEPIIIKKKKAFLTGISGQDGSYLSELLIEKGYEVHGMVRRISQPNLSNLKNVIDQVKLHTGDMTDATSIFRIINEVKSG
jgi:GDPmannose 4,6-dehydratase